MALCADNRLVTPEAGFRTCVPDDVRMLQLPRTSTSGALVVAVVAEQLYMTVGTYRPGQGPVCYRGTMAVLEICGMRDLDLVAIDTELRVDTAFIMTVRTILGQIIVRLRMKRRHVQLRAIGPVRLLVAGGKHGHCRMAVYTEVLRMTLLEATVTSQFIDSVGVDSQPWLTVYRSLVMTVAAQLLICVAIAAHLRSLTASRSMELLEVLRVWNIELVTRAAEWSIRSAITVAHLASGDLGIG